MVISSPAEKNHLFPAKPAAPNSLPQEKAHKQGSCLPVFKDDSYGMPSCFLYSLASPTSGSLPRAQLCHIVRVNHATVQTSFLKMKINTLCTFPLRTVQLRLCCITFIFHALITQTQQTSFCRVTELTFAAGSLQCCEKVSLLFFHIRPT